jgi:hypothetical protein
MSRLFHIQRAESFDQTAGALKISIFFDSKDLQGAI